MYDANSQTSSVVKMWSSRQLDAIYKQIGSLYPLSTKMASSKIFFKKELQDIVKQKFIRISKTLLVNTNTFHCQKEFHLTRHVMIGSLFVSLCQWFNGKALQEIIIFFQYKLTIWYMSQRKIFTERKRFQPRKRLLFSSSTNWQSDTCRRGRYSQNGRDSNLARDYYFLPVQIDNLIHVAEEDIHRTEEIPTSQETSIFFQCRLIIENMSQKIFTERKAYPAFKRLLFSSSKNLKTGIRRRGRYS